MVAPTVQKQRNQRIGRKRRILYLERKAVPSESLVNEARRPFTSNNPQCLLLRQIVKPQGLFAGQWIRGPHHNDGIAHAKIIRKKFGLTQQRLVGDGHIGLVVDEPVIAIVIRAIFHVYGNASPGFPLELKQLFNIKRSHIVKLNRNAQRFRFSPCGRNRFQHFVIRGNDGLQRPIHILPRLSRHDTAARASHNTRK